MITNDKGWLRCGSAKEKLHLQIDQNMISDYKLASTLDQ
jgi:hypothetical protein